MSYLLLYCYFPLTEAMPPAPPTHATLLPQERPPRRPVAAPVPSCWPSPALPAVPAVSPIHRHGHVKALTVDLAIHAPYLPSPRSAARDTPSTFSHRTRSLPSQGVVKNFITPTAFPPR